jgi:hypothetical protein
MRGLYETDDNECVGVARYDLDIFLFYQSTTFDQKGAIVLLGSIVSMFKKKYNDIIFRNLVLFKIKNDFKKHLNNQLSLSEIYNVDLESSVITPLTTDTSLTRWSCKLVVWKENAVSPVDLPVELTLSEMRRLLASFFEKTVTYQTSAKLTLLIDEMLNMIVIASGEFVNEFKSSWNLTCT